MTPNFVIYFFANEYPKYAQFHADSKSVEKIEKSAHTKNYLPKTVAS
jgi:hypothetical protein